ncbi:MAG TPA: hypothetical protein VIG32_12405 [Candidatus Baltobacteraceae bacterium]|jgi:hypothetical protein
MKRKKRLRGIVPPLGPPTNLRPAGAMESKKLYRRHRIKAALRNEDGFRLSGRSFRTIASRA